MYSEPPEFLRFLLAHGASRGPRAPEKIGPRGKPTPQTPLHKKTPLFPGIISGGRREFPAKPWISAARRRLIRISQQLNWWWSTLAAAGGQASAANPGRRVSGPGTKTVGPLVDLAVCRSAGLARWLWPIRHSRGLVKAQKVVAGWFVSLGGTRGRRWRLVGSVVTADTPRNSISRNRPGPPHCTVASNRVNPKHLPTPNFCANRCHIWNARGSCEPDSAVRLPRWDLLGRERPVTRREVPRTWGGGSVV